MGNLTNLLVAVENNEFGKVKRLLNLSNRLDIFSVSDKSLALYTAIEFRGDLEMVKLLIKNGADASVIVKNGRNSVHLAAMINRINVMNLFIQNNVDINVPNDRQFLALDIAALVGNIDIARILLDNNARVLNFERDGYAHALSLVIINWVCNSSLIELFLERGVDPNFREHDDSTLFHQSFKFRDNDIIDLFLRHGADVSLKNSNRENALHLAVRYSSYKIIEQILQMNIVDVNEEDIYGETCINNLFYLDMKKDLLPITRLLVSHGADVNKYGNDHKCAPVYYAISRCDLDLLEYLMCVGAEINRIGYYRTPLVSAILFGNEAIVKFLLHRGAKLYSELVSNKDKITSAMIDIENKGLCLKIIKVFMTKGVERTVSPNQTEVERDIYETVERFHQEVQLMKSTTISEDFDTTYYDILSKRGNALARCLEPSQILRKFLMGTYQERFPNFAENLKANYLRGLHLCELQLLLRETLKMFLPIEIIIMISEYFDDEYLDSLSKSGTV